MNDVSGLQGADLQAVDPQALARFEFGNDLRISARNWRGGGFLDGEHR